MSDEKKKDAHEDKKEEGAIAGFLNSAFWSSWIAKIATVVAIVGAVPEDKVLEEVIKPSAKMLYHFSRLTWVKTLRHGGTAVAWLMYYAKRVVGWTAIIAVSCMIATFAGIARANPVPVFIGGVAWCLCVAILTFLARRGASAVIELGREGTDLAGSTFGSILRSVGLAEKTHDDKVVAKHEAAKKVVDEAWIVFISSLLMTIALVWITAMAKSPPWWECAVAMCATLVLATSLSIALWRGIAVTNGWVYVHNTLLAFGLTLLSVALLVGPFPALRVRGAKMRAGINGWIEHPYTFNPKFASVAIGLFSIIILCFIVAAFMAADEKKTKKCMNVAKVALLLIPVMAIFMAMMGNLTLPQMEYAYNRFKTGNGEVAAPVEEAPPPMRVIKGRKATAASQEEPEPDYANMSDEELLKLAQ